jgi:AAA+ ATPase superfamily predicted ATPase
MSTPSSDSISAVDPQEPFYDRDAERAVLRDLLTSPRAELVILYGRRGVGKSALLEQTLTDAGIRHVYYRATRRTLPLQLAALTDATREAYPGTFLGQAFASVSVFLDFLAHLAGERQAANDPEPVAVVLDELPYLADVEPGLLTVLQHWWDANKRRPNLKLFIAGSYLAFMERQVLDARAPLYNRRTAAMRLEPMTYADAALFFRRYSAREKMELYAVLGGMLSYLEQFDSEKGIAENLLATALRRNTYLSEEPDWLLLEDLRRDVTYGSILRAVASGERRPSDIARAIGKESAQSVAPQLETLRELGLVAREVPITEKRQGRSRNSLYFLADHYLNFWYRYVDPNRSLVAQGLGLRVWERSVAPTLPAFVSRPAFEWACRQYLWRALVADRLPPDLSFVDVGTWWGAGDREIDVVALNERGQTVLAGSCKWTNEPMDVGDYAALQQDLAAASALKPVDGDGPWLALFSREGFTDRLRALAAAQQPARLLLVDLAAMYDEKDSR